MPNNQTTATIMTETQTPSNREIEMLLINTKINQAQVINIKDRTATEAIVAKDLALTKSNPDLQLQQTIDRTSMNHQTGGADTMKDTDMVEVIVKDQEGEM